MNFRHKFTKKNKNKKKLLKCNEIQILVNFTKKTNLEK